MTARCVRFYFEASNKSYFPTPSPFSTWSRSDVCSYAYPGRKVPTSQMHPVCWNHPLKDDQKKLLLLTQFPSRHLKQVCPDPNRCKWNVQLICTCPALSTCPTFSTKWGLAFPTSLFLVLVGSISMPRRWWFFFERSTYSVLPPGSLFKDLGL